MFLRYVMWHALAKGLGLVLVTVSRSPEELGSVIGMFQLAVSKQPNDKTLSLCDARAPVQSRFGKVIAVIRDGHDIMV